MRRMYEEMLRQMEHDVEDHVELFWRLVRCTAPRKFWEPPVDVYETREAVKIKVEVAGVRKDDLQVDLAADGRSVAIRGLRLDGDPDVNERTHYHQMEIQAGPFERRVVLPSHISVERDAVEANYDDGFLIITLPKRAPQRITTQIQVQE